MIPREARQWFTGYVNMPGTVGPHTIYNVPANKRAVITYCNIVVTEVVAGAYVEINNESLTIPVHRAPGDALSSHPMGPLFSGIPLPTGENVVFTATDAGVAALATVEGYLEHVDPAS